MAGSWTLVLTLVICFLFGFVHGLTKCEKNTILRHHNKYRRQVTSTKLPDLVWNEELAREAQAWASACKYWHRVKKWGENIGYDDDNAPQTNMEAIDHSLKMWVLEKKFNTDGSFHCCSKHVHDCCHYSQVVWKNTKSVGCGFNKCENMDGAIYTVCYYYPPGNMPKEKPY